MAAWVASNPWAILFSVTDSKFPLAELASALETQQPAAESVPEVQHSVAETAPAVQHSAAESAPITADSSTCSQPCTHTQPHA